jgi:Asp-tRNA(Asn)/Glu-tRNA(Gln) amidotransferase C subunit
MEIKSTNLKIYAKLKEHGQDASALKFGEAMLQDGSAKLVWDGDTLAQGIEIMIETPDGFLPAPDGVHILEDGTTIEVSGGIVSAVKPADAPVETPASNPAPAPVGAQSSPGIDSNAVKSIVESTIKETHFSKDEVTEIVANKIEKTEFEAKLSEQSKLIEDQKTEIEQLKNQLSAIMTLVEKLSEQPAEKPVESPKTGFAFVQDKANEDKARIDFLLKLAKERNK